MDRNQSYELDDSFALRDAGEVILVDADRPHALRTPGVTVAPQAGENAFHPLVDSDPTSRATGLAEFKAEVDLPIIGKTNLIHLAVGAAAGALIFWLIAGRKKA